jgi:hypothetical protein
MTTAAIKKIFIGPMLHNTLLKTKIVHVLLLPV